MRVLELIKAWLEQPGSGLSRRAAHGGVWVFLINLVNRGLRLARTVVLARLLAPEDFGLFGITMLALSALQRLTQTGFDAALIQKPDDTERDLDTAWTVQILRGLLLGAVLVASAPLVASFFEEPGAAALVRALAAVAVISGFKNIGVVYFRKEIEFHKQFVFRLTSTLPDFVASVVAALILQNAWALVIGLVAGRTVQTIASHRLHPYRPSLAFNLARARKLFDFGKYITGQSIVLFLLTEGDDALVGKVLGAASLGFYQIAYRISNAAATQITHVVSTVTFPVYSKLQDRRDKLNLGLIRTVAVTSFLALPVAAAIGIFAREITLVFLGENWLPMVPAMQMMCIFSAIRSIAATFGPVYRAVARVDLPLKVNVTQLIILAAIVYPLTLKGGILGTGTAITGAMVVALIYTSLLISEVTGLDLRQIYSPTIPPVVGVLFAGLQTHLLRTGLSGLNNAQALALFVPLAALTYLLVVVVIYRMAGYTYSDLVHLTESMLKTT